MGLQLPSPGVQDPGAPRESGPDEARIFGESFEGGCRGVEHGLVGGTLVRAEEGAEHRRHGEGEEEGRPGQLWLQVVVEPLSGLLLVALGTVAVATRMLDAVVPPTAGARREAVAIVSASARLDGADDRTVCEGQMGGARQVLGRKRSEDLTERGQGRSPCRRALRRVEASSCPW